MRIRETTVAILASSSPPSQAIGGPSVCTYDSDARYKTVVGPRGTGCCGSVISWGVTTFYKRCETI